MKRNNLGMALTAVVTAVVAVGGLTACGGSGSGSSGGGNYQVGFSSDLSGKFAANGTGQRDGFKSYFDYVNAHGGINGRQVTVTYTDDAGDVSRGSANTTQLITQNRVSALAGYVVSNVCGAGVPIATAQKVPINCSAVSTDLLSPVQPYVYSARIAQSNEAGPMIQYAPQVTGKANPRVAIVTFASASAAGLHDALVAEAKQKGWPIVGDESVPLTATDVTVPAAKIVAAKPDVVLGSLLDPLAVLFMRSLKAANVSIPFLDYDGATLTGAMEPLKDPNLYVLSSMTMDGQGDSPQLQQFRDATKAGNVDPKAVFVNVGYVQAMQVGEGLKACGSPCTGEKMQAALDKLNVPTGGLTSGNIAFTPTNHEGTSAGSFYVWDPSTSAVKVAAADLKGGTSS